MRRDSQSSSPRHQSTMSYNHVDRSSFLYKPEQQPPRIPSAYRPQYLVYNDRKPKWKPWIMRVPALIFVVLATLFLVGLLEWAARALPALDSDMFSTSTDGNVEEKRDTFTPVLWKRQSSSGNSGNSGNSGSSEEDITGISSGTHYGVTNGQYLNPDTGDSFYTPSLMLSSSTPVSSMSSDGYISTGVSLYTPAMSVAQTTAAPSTSDYVSIQTSFYTPSYSEQVVTLMTSDYVAQSTTLYTPSGTVTMGADNSEFIIQSRTIYTPTLAPSPSQFVQSDTYVYTPPVTSKPTNTHTGTTHTGTVQFVTQTIQYVAISNNQNPHFNPSLYPKPETSGDKQVVYAISVVYPWWATLAGSIIPVTVITIYRIVWAVLYGSVKLMEPFALLARPGGATAKECMFSYYLSISASLKPLAGLTKGHWVIVLAGVLAVIAGFLAPFASETLTTSTTSCPWALTANATNHNPCPPQLMVDLDAVRALQAFLLTVVVLTIVLGWSIYARKTTGVYADPSSVAAIASLTHHPDFIEDFERAGADPSGKSLKRFLEGRRYCLGPYETATGAYRYGFKPVSGISVPSHDEDEFGPRKPKQYGRYDHKKTNSNRKWAFIMDAVFGLVIFGLLGVIVAYYLAAGDTPFNNYFNSDTFGPRFILTGVGAVVAAQWRTIHADVSLKTVYADLSAGSAQARNTLCATRPVTPITSIFPSLVHRHYFACLVAVIAVLADILIIALPVIPYKSGEFRIQFIVATYFSIGVLALMLLTMISVSVWRWRRVPHFPLLPDTLAGVVNYVASSSLLRDTEELEFLSGPERDLRLDGMGKRWMYGRVVGMDGQTRWMVDEDTVG